MDSRALEIYLAPESWPSVIILGLNCNLDAHSFKQIISAFIVINFHKRELLWYTTFLIIVFLLPTDCGCHKAQRNMPSDQRNEPSDGSDCGGYTLLLLFVFIILVLVGKSAQMLYDTKIGRLIASTCIDLLISAFIGLLVMVSALSQT